MQAGLKIINDWQAETLGNRAVSALQKNGFGAEYASSIKDATKKILELVPNNASVGFGGSLTIMSTGINPALAKKGCTIYSHNAGKDREESIKLGKLESTADVFLTSTNALTLDGKLVNTDSRGNRVAAMMHGPGKVIVVVGYNKIVANIDDAFKRIEQVVAPRLAKSIAMRAPEVGADQNPCLKTGTCVNCNSPGRICNVTTILHKKPSDTDIHVIVVGETVGF